MSIKNKIILLVLICFFTIIAFAGSVIYVQQEKSIEKEAKWFGQELGGEAAIILFELMEAEAYHSKNTVLEAFVKRPEIESIHVFRSPILEVQFGTAPAESKARSSFEQLIFGSKKAVSRVVDGAGGKTVEVVVPMITQKGKCLECHKGEPGFVIGGVGVNVRVGMFGEAIRQDRKDILKVTVAFTVFLIFFIMSMLSRLVDKPIRAVVDAAESIADGQISRVKLDIKEGKDEVGRLATAFSKMTASLTEISSSAKAMAEGDLSSNIDQSGELAESFNGMVSNLGRLVERIRMSSTTLGDSVDKISGISKEQSEGAQEQISEVQKLEQTMDDLSKSASSASDQGDKMYKIAQNSLQSVQQGREAAKEGQKAMDKINAGMEETAARVEELNQKTAQITKVLEMIDDIAMETKILSVNASIEASNAGEMGKGFSVVAEEIAKLAENVVQATATIKATNDEIQNFSGILTKTIDDSKGSVTHGVDTMKMMDKNLEEILFAATNTAEAAQNISRLSKDQNDKNKGVLSKMEIITSKAKDLSRSAQKSTDEVDRIKELFGSLQTEVSRFRISGDPGSDTFKTAKGKKITVKDISFDTEEDKDKPAKKRSWGKRRAASQAAKASEPATSKESEKEPKKTEASQAPLETAQQNAVQPTPASGAETPLEIESDK
ncbi:MAG: methyl-accepting chemotaxis protein [Nitrospinota bacterium]